MVKQLKRTETNTIKKTISDQFGIDKKDLDFLDNLEFIKSSKDRISIISKLDENLSKLRVEGGALYIGRFQKDNGFRLSIEGSIMFGKFAKKNIIDLTEKQLNEWMKGYDLEIKEEQIANIEDHSYVLLRFREYFVGSSKLINNEIKCTVPKERRLLSKKFIV